MLRGLRGAITVKSNRAEEIKTATARLLKAMVSANGVRLPQIASIIFSVTRDLNAAFPAEAARKMGWTSTPLLCTYEIAVRGSVKRCVRILMHVNTPKLQVQMKHVYLEGAKRLREDF